MITLLLIERFDSQLKYEDVVSIAPTFGSIVMEFLIYSDKIQVRLSHYIQACFQNEEVSLQLFLNTTQSNHTFDLIV